MQPLEPTKSFCMDDYTQTNQLTGILFDIQRFCVHDGPGIRTNLFFKGCPIRCEWCHNPEGWLSYPQLSFHAEKCQMCGRCAAVCPNAAHTIQGSTHAIDRDLCVNCGRCVSVCAPAALEIVGKRYTLEQVLAEGMRDEIFYGNGGGVTLSGGEPMMQADFVIALAKAFCERGISVCIETSGVCSPEKLAELAPFIDRFLFDIKETNAARHMACTGASMQPIHENLELLNRLQANIVLRCPIIPGKNDRADHFDEIAKLARRLDRVLQIDLEPYHPFGLEKGTNVGAHIGYANRSAMPKAELLAWREYLSRLVDVPVVTY